MPQHLFVCTVDERHIFLDLVADRYFALPSDADAAFGRLLHERHHNPAAAETGMLVGAGILVPAPQGKPLAATAHPRANGSLPEKEGHAVRPGLRDIAEIWRLVRQARRAIARKDLPRLFQRLRAATPPSPSGGDELERLTRRFLAARRLVPVAPNCLQDSLALRLFLTRRAAGAPLIIGVKLHPFGAHCWLQQDGIVLNDALGSALEFQPVLVV